MRAVVKINEVVHHVFRAHILVLIYKVLIVFLICSFNTLSHQNNDIWFFSQMMERKLILLLLSRDQTVMAR